MVRVLAAIGLTAVMAQAALAETPWHPVQVPASDVRATQHKFDPATGRLVPVEAGAGQAQPGRVQLHVTPHSAPLFDAQTGQFRTQGDMPQTRYNPHTGQWETTQPEVNVQVEIKDPPSPQP